MLMDSVGRYEANHLVMFLLFLILIAVTGLDERTHLGQLEV